MNRYQEGALIRISGAFTDPSGVPIDPTTVTLRVKKPSGVVTTLVYGTDAALKKDSVGNYYYDADTTIATPTTVGTWTYEWKSTGTGQTAGAGQFYVYDLLS